MVVKEVLSDVKFDLMELGVKDVPNSKYLRILRDIQNSFAEGGLAFQFNARINILADVHTYPLPEGFITEYHVETDERELFPLTDNILKSNSNAKNYQIMGHDRIKLGATPSTDSEGGLRVEGFKRPTQSTSVNDDYELLTLFPEYLSIVQNYIKTVILESRPNLVNPNTLQKWEILYYQTLDKCKCRQRAKYYGGASQLRRS